jgi:RNase P/RNase MRP subunit p30
MQLLPASWLAKELKMRTVTLQSKAKEPALFSIKDLMAVATLIGEDWKEVVQFNCDIVERELLRDK